MADGLLEIITCFFLESTNVRIAQVDTKLQDLESTNVRLAQVETKLQDIDEIKTQMEELTPCK